MKTTIFSFITLLLLQATAWSQIGSRQTTFKPEVHGFKFSNTLEVEVINDIRMSGFCGGMVYTALDYFKARKAVPSQTYKPNNGSTLYDYMWGRQRSSVLDNLDKWTELFVNPFGWRTNEFFNWGLQGFNGGRLEELKKEIDKGSPVPLGLFKPGDGGAGPHHQVLAIGYKGGRYKGDLGQYKEDLEIQVYDPNFPGETRTLKPNPAANIYYYKEDPDNTRCQWQTYFVNRKYNYNAPPNITTPVLPVDGKIRQLLVEIRTGGDDLRGGNDNLSITLNFKTKPSQTFNNVNRGARWIGNYTETVPVTLTTPVDRNELKDITLVTNFRGGIDGDNWNVDRVRVVTNGEEVANKSGAPLVRFTGDIHKYSIPFKPTVAPPPSDEMVQTIMFDFRTGGDDLRGGNDNVNITIKFHSLPDFVLKNANKSVGWPGNSTRTVSVRLPAPVKRSELKECVFATTFGGGMFGDNWNMDQVKVRANGKTLAEEAGVPLVRFNGNNTPYVLPL